MKEKWRQAYIENIMQTKFSSDDPKYDGKNRAFLETLTLNELENLSDDVILEEDIKNSKTTLPSTIDIQFMKETGLVAVTQYGKTIELCSEDIQDLAEFADIIKHEPTLIKRIANRNDFK